MEKLKDACQNLIEAIDENTVIVLVYDDDREEWVVGNLDYMREVLNKTKGK